MVDNQENDSYLSQQNQLNGKKAEHPKEQSLAEELFPLS
jgi:hypothetical protein